MSVTRIPIVTTDKSALTCFSLRCAGAISQYDLLSNATVEPVVLKPPCFTNLRCLLYSSAASSASPSVAPVGIDHICIPEVVGSPIVFSLAVYGEGTAKRISTSTTSKLVTFEELILPIIFTSPPIFTSPVTITFEENVVIFENAISVPVKADTESTLKLEVARFPEPTSTIKPFGLFVSFVVNT